TGERLIRDSRKLGLLPPLAEAPPARPQDHGLAVFVVLAYGVTQTRRVRRSPLPRVHERVQEPPPEPSLQHLALRGVARRIIDLFEGFLLTRRRLRDALRLLGDGAAFPRLAEQLLVVRLFLAEEPH